MITSYILPVIVKSNFASSDYEFITFNNGSMTAILWSLKTFVQTFYLVSLQSPSIFISSQQHLDFVAMQKLILANSSCRIMLCYDIL